MKLSKVTYRVKDKNAKYKKEYNVRAAVANNSENAGGVLYHVPGVDLIDLKEQMLDRDRSVRLLYNIFNQIQTGTKPKNGKMMKHYPWMKMNVKLKSRILK